MFFNCWSTQCSVYIYVKSIPGSRFLVKLLGVPGCCFWCLPQQMRVSVKTSCSITLYHCFVFQ